MQGLLYRKTTAPHTFADSLNSFRALASIAYRWNENYVNDGFGWDADWLPIFVKYGWLKPKTVTVYEPGDFDRQ